MTHHNEEECCCGGMGKILLGCVIGAGLALLLAPESGKKTREFLAGKAKDLGGKANEAAADFADTLSEFVDNAADRATELLHQGADLSQDSKKTILKALEKGQEILEKQRKKLEAMID